MPTISVIVPVFQAEQFIMRCAESICNQTYPNLEIILVNDGSSDCSSQMCDELTKMDNRIRVIHQDNAGVSSARNTGLCIANGEYITFADSDDTLHPEMIEKLYRLICENNADIASCDYTSNDTELGTFCDTTPLTFDAVNGISDMLCNRNITYSVYCKLFSQSTVNDIRFHTEYSHNEDLLFCYETFLTSRRIIHTKEKLYLYYINPNSATRVVFSHKRMTAIDVQEQILADIQTRFPCSDLAKTAKQQFLKVNIYTGMQMMKAGYKSSEDNQRIRKNIKNLLPELLRGDLAIGYKAYGLLISIAPRLCMRMLIH